MMLTGLAACGAPADEAAATDPESAAPAQAAAPSSPGFDETYESQGVTFHVQSSGGQVTVTPTGLSATNEAMVRDIDGAVTGAQVEDMDANGSPEIYVFVRSDDDQERGSLVAFAVNNGASMSDIYLPPIPGENMAGYSGHDEFTVAEGMLSRRFRIYGEDGQPTEQYRQLQYRLAQGEASWVLALDRVVEF